MSRYCLVEPDSLSFQESNKKKQQKFKSFCTVHFVHLVIPEESAFLFCVTAEKKWCDDNITEEVQSLDSLFRFTDFS